jgi:hypothetical protein
MKSLGFSIQSAIYLAQGLKNIKKGKGLVTDLEGP